MDPTQDIGKKNVNAQAQHLKIDDQQVTGFIHSILRTTENNRLNIKIWRVLCCPQSHCGQHNEIP